MSKVRLSVTAGVETRPMYELHSEVRPGWFVTMIVGLHGGTGYEAHAYKLPDGWQPGEKAVDHVIGIGYTPVLAMWGAEARIPREDAA